MQKYPPVFLLPRCSTFPAAINAASARLTVARLTPSASTMKGTRVPFIVEALGVSRATVKRALAALIAAGKVEHRGSKKTGGYFCIPRLRNGSVRPPTSYFP